MMFCTPEKYFFDLNFTPTCTARVLKFCSPGWSLLVLNWERKDTEDWMSGAKWNETVLGFSQNQSSSQSRSVSHSFSLWNSSSLPLSSSSIGLCRTASLSPMFIAACLASQLSLCWRFAREPDAYGLVSWFVSRCRAMHRSSLHLCGAFTPARRN